MAEVQIIKLGANQHEPVAAGDTLAPGLLPLSAEADNSVELKADGLYVPEAEKVEFAAGTTTTLAGAGSAADPYKVEIKSSTDPDNVVTSDANGVVVKNSSLTFDQVNSELTFTDNKGTQSVIDLSEFLTDIHVESGSFDPATTMLTLQTNDPANPTISVNLGDLAKSATVDTATAKITGDGSTGNGLQVDVQVSADADNRLTASATGLLVTSELPAGGTAGQVLTKGAGTATTWNDAGLASVATTDTTTIDFSGDGTAATPVTGAVKLATGGVNRITAEATGLRVTAELPAYTAADNGKKLAIVAGVPQWQEDAPCLVETRAGTGTLVEGDTGKLVLGTGGTITAPASLPIGFRVDLVGAVTVAVTGGTLRSVDGNTKVVADGGATLIKTSATEFWLAGALEA